MNVRRIISRAPARICLFGDHQDYLGLPVITTAIDRYITVEGTPISRDLWSINMPDLQIKRTIDLQEDFSQFKPDDHLKASLHVARSYGMKFNQGYEVNIHGSIPINAGLSSSSALVVAWLQFLAGSQKVAATLDAELLGKMAYEAEVVVTNSPGGKMDQYAIAIGEVLFMNMSEPFSYTRLSELLPSLVIGESGDPKKTNAILSYAKAGALHAIKQVKKVVTDFTIEKVVEGDVGSLLPHIDKSIRPYFKAAVLNHDITLSALEELKNTYPDPEILGKMMTRHHRILESYLSTTTPKIDQMINVSLEHGAYGAKIVGSGGGGCIVALAHPDRVDKIIEELKLAGAKDAYQVKIARGASLMQ